MRECGEVVAVAGEFAQVKVIRGDKCGECRVCQALGEGGGVMEARNTIGAAVGDMVEVEVNPKVVVGHSFLLFIFPLLLFLVGYALGRAVPWPGFMSAEARGISVAFLSLGTGFLLIRVYDRRFARAGKGGPEVVSFAAPPLHDIWTAH
ncbi:MAG: SoxR reducing system RseC family protein [bacterium]|jgi:sigma-E factor negative regulatory protein RseC|nr:SoxR reducing system RseC family protein [candidate division KSB1 bacterium]MDH7558944.1 SoxR reducing system RseC family protein [bacterium]